MELKNNYNECITNLACSIRKYFELDYKHNTIDYIDKILEERKPKNVVTILFDGMSSNIIDNILPSDSFMIRNRLKMDKEAALFFLVNGKKVLTGEDTMQEIYNKYKSDDGFLYIAYASEIVWGN